MRLAGLGAEAAACGFKEHFACGDVPLADLFFNVGIESATGDVGESQGGAAKHPCFTDFDGDALEAVEAGFEGFAAFGEAYGDDGFCQGLALADLEGLPVQGGDAAFFYGPGFVLHGIIDDAGDVFAIPFSGDGNAEVGDAVEVVHGAINGVHDPLSIAVRITGVAFFSFDAVVREGFEQDLGDEVLAADIEIELDVVLEHFINGEHGAEVFPLEFSGGVCGFDGD